MQSKSGADDYLSEIHSEGKFNIEFPVRSKIPFEKEFILIFKLKIKVNLNKIQFIPQKKKTSYLLRMQRNFFKLQDSK